jgi:hypothetical protein
MNSVHRNAPTAPVPDIVKRTVALLCTASLAACGGGDGGGGATPIGGSLNPGTSPSAIPPSSTYAQQCAAGNMLAPAANRTATLDTERRFVRSYLNEAYLWYSEVPAVDTSAAAFNQANVQASLSSYFDALLTPARTPSGKFKDQFSFTFPTAEWNALSQSGTAAGFGAEWFLGSPTPPRNIRIAFVDPGTPAAAANLARGMTLVSVNGVSADDNTPAGTALLNEVLLAPRNNVAYNFVFTNTAGATVSAAVTAGTVTKVPVQNTRVIDSGGVKVGYLTFNDHIAPSEGQLLAAFNTLAQQNVTELVLDLRYNGGGFLYIASQVSYMIAGATRTANKTFEKLLFNDKRVADNNDPQNNTPFFNVTSGFAGTGTAANTALPQLSLQRVFLLVSGGSCSASESIINALRGIDVPVILIGRTTCGKPYGFTAKDNCGLSYFPIEFRGVNHKGFGEYADGFVPMCNVADDLTRPLGDAAEGMLAAALTYRATGACPPGTAVQAASVRSSAAGAADTGRIARHPVREGKYR